MYVNVLMKVSLLVGSFFVYCCDCVLFPPTRSLGMSRSDEPCFKNTFPVRNGEREKEKESGVRENLQSGRG